MSGLTSKQASILSLVAFAITVAFCYTYPANNITLTGFLVVIFLSVFAPGTWSTLIAATVSVFATFINYWFTEENLRQHIFLIILMFLSSVIVLYLKRLYKHIQFEKSHMTALFENATEGILLTDQAGKIVLANAASERMFGYEIKDLINRPVELLLPDSARSKHVELRHTFYDRPEHRSMGYGRDLYAQKQSGELFPVEVSLSYYYRGEKQYVIAFIVDITRRKQIEASMKLQQKQLEKVSSELKDLNTDLEMKVEERTLILKEALQKLEQSQKELSESLDKERQLNEIKGRFVSMASHEFRTPLSTVLSSASLLSKYVKEEEQDKRNKHIERIKGAVKHLNDILEDFLSLGKLDEGKVLINYAPFELDVFIEETIEDMSGLLKAGQKVLFNHDGEHIIYSDKRLLKNVMLNLISNAIKFSERDTSIHIDSSVLDGSATITVKDEGVGISEEDQRHLFSSFFRGGNVLNIQGTGLGLHIVKRYLELLGGTISLESSLNRGTTITIVIKTKITYE